MNSVKEYFLLKLIPVTAIFYFALPSISTAQQTFAQFAGRIITVLNLGAQFIMALALLAFVFGTIRFISTAGDDKGRESGRQLMIWGTISLFLMVAVWGIVAIIEQTFFGA